MDRQRLVRNGAVVVIALVGVTLALGYARRLMGVDPFSRFASRAQPTTLASLKDVDMVHYRRDQLIGKAHVGELSMRSDKTTFDLSKVYDGVIYSDQGKIDFTADEATWDSSNLRLAVTSGANVSNKDFNLRVPSFTLDQRAGTMVVPKEIRGRFFGGRIAASNFMYNLNTGGGTVGASTWVGKADMRQDTGEPPTKWTFQSTGGAFSKKGMEVWENARATDGDVVVQAKTIERNTKTDVITATGECLYFSKKANMACDKVVVYRKEKRALLTGNVRMLIKPKDSMERELKVDTGEIPPFRPNLPEHMVANAPAPSQSSDEKALDDEVRSGKTTRTYPTVILGSTVEYWYSKGNRHAVVSGSPQATQQLAGTRWRKVWATRARYDGEANSVLLESAEKKPDVRMKNSQGDDLLARSFTFSTEEGNDDWSAQDLQGTVTADNQEETGTGTTTTPPPPKAGAAKKPVEKTSPEVKKPTTEVKKPTPGDKTTEQKPTDAPPAKP